MADDTQAISIRFPLAIYERLRKAAFDRREPMNTIVLRATERELDGLDKHDPDSSKEQEHG